MEALEVSQRWCNQTSTLLEMATSAAASIDKGLAMLKQASALEDKRTVAGLNAEITRARSSYLASEKLLLAMTRTDNLSAARALVVDVGVRVEAADRLYMNWRALLATQQLVMSVGGEQVPEDAAVAGQVQAAEVCYHVSASQAYGLLPAGAEEELLQ